MYQLLKLYIKYIGYANVHSADNRHWVPETITCNDWRSFPSIAISASETKQLDVYFSYIKH